MKEYPILFSGPMVRAILEGRKTVTRRINVDRWMKRKKGDQLWVRETWCTLAAWDGVKPSDLSATVQIKYIADNSITKPTLWPWGVSRPSIFIPRWASRILLELTEDPREERLQEITEEDAIAEGVQPWKFNEQQAMTSGELGAAQPFRGGFACDWDERHDERTDRTWFANPKVAVVRFRRIAA